MRFRFNWTRGGQDFPAGAKRLDQHRTQRLAEVFVHEGNDPVLQLADEVVLHLPGVIVFCVLCEGFRVLLQQPGRSGDESTCCGPAECGAARIAVCQTAVVVTGNPDYTVRRDPLGWSPAPPVPFCD